MFWLKIEKKIKAYDEKAKELMVKNKQKSSGST